MKYWARTVGILLGLALSALAWGTQGSLLRAESLRAAPAANAAIVAGLAKGSAVDVLARQGGWMKVRSGTKVGWVRLLSVRPGQSRTGGSDLAGVAGLVTRRPDASRVVSVAGVRGLSEEDLKSAKFNAPQLEKMDTYGVSAAAARRFAASQELKARQVAQLPAPAPAGQGSPWGGETP